MQLLCFGFAETVAFDEMLRNTEWRLDGAVFGTVAMPSNDKFYVPTQTDMSYYFINCVLTCANFD